MPYPKLGGTEARRVLYGHTESAAVTEASSGAIIDWDALAADTCAKLDTLAQTHIRASGKIEGRAFEIAAAPIIHCALPAHPALGDREFWTWLAIIHGRAVIERRYSAPANPENFGVGGAVENFLFRLWLSAEIAFDPNLERPYALVEVGDVDLWRSHILRQGYADCRDFARALLEFQRDRALATDPIRDLVKQLRRARSNVQFEMMSRARARSFIEAEWRSVASRWT